MRLLLVTVLFLTALAGPVRAQSDGDRTAIRDVITSQIRAFRQDDAAGAYFYAAPAIQEMFPTPEVFIRMVRQGYRTVYRPRSYVFAELGWEGGRLIQPVRMIGPEGRSVIAHYIMEQQPGGEWKIAGVFLVKGPDETA